MDADALIAGAGVDIEDAGRGRAGALDGMGLGSTIGFGTG